MIEVDVKHRSIGPIRWYTTFGDELPVQNLQKTTDKIRTTLSDSAHSNGLSALTTALRDADQILHISEYAISARLFARADVDKIPKEGWEYDW